MTVHPPGDWFATLRGLPCFTKIGQRDAIIWISTSRRCSVGRVAGTRGWLGLPVSLNQLARAANTGRR